MRAAPDRAPLDEVRFRPAADDEFDPIERSIRRWSDRQVLLPLSNGALRVLFPDFRVLAGPGAAPMLAFGALRRYSPRLAEIRSLVVAEDWRGRGLGRRLVSELIDEARREGVARVFVLTRSPRLFASLGFAPVRPESLPQKVFVDCSTCAKRLRCDETAFVKDLR